MGPKMSVDAKAFQAVENAGISAATLEEQNTQEFYSNWIEHKTIKKGDTDAYIVVVTDAHGADQNGDKGGKSKGGQKFARLAAKTVLKSMESLLEDNRVSEENISAQFEIIDKKLREKVKGTKDVSNDLKEYSWAGVAACIFEPEEGSTKEDPKYKCTMVNLGHTGVQLGSEGKVYEAKQHRPSSEGQKEWIEAHGGTLNGPPPAPQPKEDGSAPDPVEDPDAGKTRVLTDATRALGMYQFKPEGTPQNDHLVRCKPDVQVIEDVGKGSWMTIGASSSFDKDQSKLMSEHMTLSQKSAFVTKKVKFEVSIDGEDKGTIEFGLFGDVAPKTVENFLKFCQGTTVKVPKKSKKKTDDEAEDLDGGDDSGDQEPENVAEGDIDATEEEKTDTAGGEDGVEVEFEEREYGYQGMKVKWSVKEAGLVGFGEFDDDGEADGGEKSEADDGEKKKPITTCDEEEIPKMNHDRPGLLTSFSIANMQGQSKPNEISSGFTICKDTFPQFDGQFRPFGIILKGEKVFNAICEVDPETPKDGEQPPQLPPPGKDIVIEKVEVIDVDEPIELDPPAEKEALHYTQKLYQHSKPPEGGMPPPDVPNVALAFLRIGGTEKSEMFQKGMTGKMVNPGAILQDPKNVKEAEHCLRFADFFGLFEFEGKEEFLQKTKEHEEACIQRKIDEADAAKKQRAEEVATATEKMEKRIGKLPKLWSGEDVAQFPYMKPLPKADQGYFVMGVMVIVVALVYLGLSQIYEGYQRLAGDELPAEGSDVDLTQDRGMIFFPLVLFGSFLTFRVRALRRQMTRFTGFVRDLEMSLLPSNIV